MVVKWRLLVMTIKAILELKKTHKEMTEVLDELEVYEDGIDADWTETVTDYRWLLQMCKHRLTSLKQRKNMKE